MEAVQCKRGVCDTCFSPFLSGPLETDVSRTQVQRASWSPVFMLPQSQRVKGMGGACAMQKGPRLSWHSEVESSALTVPLTLIIVDRALLLQHASAPDKKEEWLSSCPLSDSIY